MADATASDQGARAELRVLAGGAPYEARFFDARPSRILVGSDPAATLRFERLDVAPRQLDVIWDGSHLWIQDALRLGRTFVNGRRLNEWVCVLGSTFVCFGGVRLWLDSHAGPPKLPSPDFAALDRARLNEVQHSAYLRLRDTGRFTLPPELLSLIERDAP